MPADAEAGVTIERGCFASFLVAAIASSLVACATTGPPQATSAFAGGSVSAERPADQALANTIDSQLNANPTYYFRHVEVRVDHGVAHLSGYVWSTDAIYAAGRIARSVPGVTGVVTSELELERNGRSNGVTR